MSPEAPTVLPPGSWGGDADPSTATRRLAFERDLARQTEARQAALAGQPLIAPAGAPMPAVPTQQPRGGGLYIPPEIGVGGDLISAQGEEELRSANDARRAMGQPTEQAVAPTAADTVGLNAGVMADHPETPAGGEEGMVVRDAAGVLQKIAQAVEQGLPALMRATATRIAQGRVPRAQLAGYLEAASQIVTAAVKVMAG
ncbi:MAG: hypothetical protein MUC88_00320 [Planctomycetes bacterium]|nr:hypothetical protein [Planctomycetota bacterium]